MTVQERRALVAVEVIGAITALFVFSTAWLHAPSAWDSWYYHVPFAGRLVGLLPDDSFHLNAVNRARYQGFALFGELLQGILWKLTGRVSATNLVACGSVLGFAGFLYARFRVPFFISCVALFAVPLVQTHASSAYVDLPGNVAAAVVVLVALDAWREGKGASEGDVVLSVLGVAVAANTKPLLQPIATLALAAVTLRYVRTAWPKGPLRPVLLLLAWVVGAMPLVFFTPLKDLVLHHNPVYPIELRAFGHLFPGAEEPYAYAPAWLAHVPRPVAFVCSLLEMKARPLSDPRRWTVDQWAPEETGGNRMGGFFHAYVLVLLLLLALRAVRRPETRRVGLGFLVFTAIVSVMPQSLELRYYLCWMLVLVALNLALAWEAESHDVLGPVPLSAFATIALFTVIGVTRGAYVWPGGDTFQDLLEARVDQREIDDTSDGTTLVVRHGPFNVLYADRFHPGRHYRTVEAEVPNP